MIPVWLIVLIRGRMPQPLYWAIAASVRYWARMKGYWYLLTDVYPAGLFGDRPEPAPSGLWPARPGRSRHSRSRCRRITRSCCRPTMWHRQRRRPLPGCRDGWSCPGRPSGSWASPWASGPSPPWHCLCWSSRPRMPRPPARLRAAAGRRGRCCPASTAPAPSPSAAPVRPASTGQWLTGLTSLRGRMDNAMVSNSGVVTNVSLSTTARQLSRCSAGLSALGPPTAQLRHVHRLAARACHEYEQGAACFVAGF